MNRVKTWVLIAALGGLFVLTTLAFPRGLIGALRHLRWTRPRAPPGAVPAPVAAKEPS